MKAKILKNDSVYINLNEICGDYARLNYHVLMDTNPSENKNYLAIWQVDDSVKGPIIPWKKVPYKTSLIELDDQDGTVTMKKLGLAEGGYIIGYSLSPYIPETNVNNFCASVYVSSLKPHTEVVKQSISLTVGDIQNKSIKVTYQTLTDYCPASNQNWIGIWDIEDDIYKDLPVAACLVSDNTSCGEVFLDKFPATSGHSYVVGYFTSGWNKEWSVLPRTGMAALTTFSMQ